MAELDLHISMSEDAPLLGNDDVSSPISRPSTPTLPDRKDGHSRFLSRLTVSSKRAVIFLMTFLMFCIVASGMLLLVPLYRIIEDTICHVHYQDESDDIIDEMKCKVEEVQSRLAFLLGWFGLLSSVISLIVAFPFGMLSDRIGRKPTLLLSYLGVAVSFYFSPFMLGKLNHTVRRNPYVLMWGYLFQLIGGGVPVLLATLYAIVTDVSGEQEKAKGFLYLTFGATAGGLVGPVLAGVLMQYFGPWMPIYVVLGINPILFMVVLLTPETMKLDVNKTQQVTQESGVAALKKHMAKGFTDMKQSLDMLKNINVSLILVTFFVQNARFSAYTATLSQYISTNFGWKLAEISVLLAPFGLLNLVVLASLPKISDILTSPRFGLMTVRKDLFLTQISTVLIILGAIIEGLSPNIGTFLFGLFVNTLGAADSPLARATLTHYFDLAFTSRMYALIGMAEVLGSFIGGPVLAVLFDIGLKRKGGWRGLPWFYVGALSIVALAALLFVRVPKTKPTGIGEESGSEDGLDTYPPSPELLPSAV